LARDGEEEAIGDEFLLAWATSDKHRFGKRRSDRFLRNEG
jgi:hypothetical protein